MLSPYTLYSFYPGFLADLCIIKPSTKQTYIFLLAASFIINFIIKNNSIGFSEAQNNASAKILRF